MLSNCRRGSRRAGGIGGGRVEEGRKPFPGGMSRKGCLFGPVWETFGGGLGELGGELERCTGNGKEG